MEQTTKKKLVKFILFLFLILLVLTIKNGCNSDEKPKTKVEIEQDKKDSIQEVRNKKIELALTFLKTKIQENMKNPDSYDMVQKDYDKNDTLNEVKMYIKFRGDNSFGGKSISRVDAIYYFDKDDVKIVNQSVE